MLDWEGSWNLGVGVGSCHLESSKVMGQLSIPSVCGKKGFPKGGEFKVLAECPGGMIEEETGKNDQGDMINGLGDDSRFP